MPKGLIVNQFIVTIKVTDHKEESISHEELNELTEAVSNALDNIEFSQIIRQKFDQHNISGVSVRVEDI